MVDNSQNIVYYNTVHNITIKERPCFFYIKELISLMLKLPASIQMKYSENIMIFKDKLDRDILINF